MFDLIMCLDNRQVQAACTYYNILEKFSFESLTVQNLSSTTQMMNSSAITAQKNIDTASNNINCAEQADDYYSLFLRQLFKGEIASVTTLIHLTCIIMDIEEQTKDNREEVDSRTMSNLIDSLVRFHQDDMGSPKKGF